MKIAFAVNLGFLNSLYRLKTDCKHKDIKGWDLQHFQIF